MRRFEVAHRVFKVSDFLGWQREGSLQLSPSFQRRPVWKKAAKSYLIDTVVRGLPVPIIFIRDRLDLDTQRTVREVVDGQQRLRTLLAFIDRSTITDFNPDNDDFTVSRKHNKDIADMPFRSLTDAVKTALLSYEFSTQVLPSSTEDRDVLQIFARLNSTGDQLTHQELRNAAYFGPFKSLMYELAFEQLDRWRQWSIFSEQQIARMNEVELTSDLVLTMMNGIYGKSQPKIDRAYRGYDDVFPYSEEVRRRFRAVMDEIDGVVGFAVPTSIYTRDVFFYSLFAYIYDKLFELGADLDHKVPKRRIDRRKLADCLLLVSERFGKRDVPEDVMDAVVRASSDYGRRLKRHEFLSSTCG